MTVAPRIENKPSPSFVVEIFYRKNLNLNINSVKNIQPCNLA
jgi:hypothetical protein